MPLHVVGCELLVIGLMASTSASKKDSALRNRKRKLTVAEIVPLLDASSDTGFDDSVMAVFHSMSLQPCCCC